MYCTGEFVAGSSIESYGVVHRPEVVIVVPYRNRDIYSSSGVKNFSYCD